jgi:UDP-4-amino-4,6-dideoxy-N-acetyl-beta-L-altrosamine transaminase
MQTDVPYLPYGRHSVDDNDIAAVEEVLRSDFLTTGEVPGLFERAIANTTGSRHTVSCSSGTAALHLAALSLKLGPGDTVIVPSITFLATANAARYVGADVIFADVDPETGLMRPSDLSDALERANGTARAVFPVHLAGQCAEMTEILEISRANNLSIVEDASHALGSTYSDGNNDFVVGSCSHSDMVVFSFHPVKTIAMGEGGAITTNDLKRDRNLRLLRNNGMVRNDDEYINSQMAFDESGEPNPWYYEMHDIGFNYRASDIHCALALSQLGKLPQFSQRRQALAKYYDQSLELLAPLLRPTRRVPNCTPVWHLYSVLVDFNQAGTDRATLMRLLQKRGVGTQVHYIPVHLQPYYRDLYGDLTLPGCNAYYDKCLSLPLFPDMENKDVERVVSEVSTLLKSIDSP